MVYINYMYIIFYVCVYKVTQTNFVGEIGIFEKKIVKTSKP